MARRSRFAPTARKISPLGNARRRSDEKKEAQFAYRSAADRSMDLFMPSKARCSGRALPMMSRSMLVTAGLDEQRQTLLYIRSAGELESMEGKADAA
jgi:hypothetical protein